MGISWHGSRFFSLKSIVFSALATCLTLSLQAEDLGSYQRGVGSGPDVIAGDLSGTRNWGTVGDIVAYSVGTTSCNIGDETLNFVGNTNQHPVVGLNMYRLKNGRLEQLGQSWLAHGFVALAQSFCGPCQNPGNTSLLGIGCSNPRSAILNGDQNGGGFGGGLGPRFEVNPATGEFAYPYTFQGDDGDAIYKRLQVRVDDLDPSFNAGALYFVEAHFVAPDDAAAGNHNNNASYREVSVSGRLDLSFAGATVREQPAINAWQDIDPTVELVNVDVANDGRFHVANKVSDNGDGTWRYEYAIHNLNSHRAANGFTVPIAPGTTVTHVGFKDVPYHSGEPYDDVDWVSEVNAGDVTWDLGILFANGFETGDTSAWSVSARSGAAIDTANALRWGTMYNFWFDADRGPGNVTATIQLHRPGTPSSADVTLRGPQ